MASVAMDTSDVDTTMKDESPAPPNAASSINLSSASTTIDPSVGQSRILQSDSVQREQEEEQPHFPKLSAVKANGNKVEYRRVRCPPHRYTPLREHWEQILTPLVEYLKLQVGGVVWCGVVWCKMSEKYWQLVVANACDE